MDFCKARDGAERQQKDYRQKNRGLFQFIAPLSTDMANDLQNYVNNQNSYKCPKADIENRTNVCPDGKRHFIERVHRENNVFLIDGNHPQANGL